jgi:hypothetical protein
MKLNNEKWLANLKKVVEQTKWQASSGQACAVATVMTIKQGMIDDVGGADMKGEEEYVMQVSESLKELVEEIAKPETKLQGFASNASAAAKAAGLEVKQVAVAMLGDLMA